MSIERADLNLDAETTKPLVRVRRRRRRARENAGPDLIQIMRETMREVLSGHAHKASDGMNEGTTRQEEPA